MDFVGAVVALLFIVPAIGQMNITSDLDAAGRKFSCTGEVVTYTCSEQGSILFVASPPLFNQHAFRSIDPVPDVQLFPSSIVTLTSGMPNYIANLQIRVTEQMRINVSCSASIDSLNNNVLPLIHESEVKPPSTVTVEVTSRSVQISWTPRLNPQFDIDYYLVNIYIDNELNTTKRSRDSYLDVSLPGEITANVRTVTACGSISTAQWLNGSVSLEAADDESVSVNMSLYAGIWVSTFGNAVLISSIVIVVILVVFHWRARMKVSKRARMKGESLQDNEKSI